LNLLVTNPSPNGAADHTGEFVLVLVHTRFNDDSGLDGVLHDREITFGLLAVKLETNA
jgi:hypothetical protein